LLSRLCLKPAAQVILGLSLVVEWSYRSSHTLDFHSHGVWSQPHSTRTLPCFLFKILGLSLGIVQASNFPRVTPGCYESEPSGTRHPHGKLVRRLPALAVLLEHKNSSFHFFACAFMARTQRQNIVSKSEEGARKARVGGIGGRVIHLKGPVFLARGQFSFVACAT